MIFNVIYELLSQWDVIDVESRFKILQVNKRLSVKMDITVWQVLWKAGIVYITAEDSLAVLSYDACQLVGRSIITAWPCRFMFFTLQKGRFVNTACYWFVFSYFPHGLSTIGFNVINIIFIHAIDS